MYTPRWKLERESAGADKRSGNSGLNSLLNNVLYTGCDVVE